MTQQEQGKARQTATRKARTLGLALALALVAPSDEQAAAAARLCDNLARRMSESEVKAAKVVAIHIVDEIEVGAASAQAGANAG